MSLISGPAGLCVLTEDHGLAFYDASGRLVPHVEFSALFAQHNAALLTAYRGGHNGMHLGTIMESAQAHPWGKITFVYDEPLVRAVYPSGGSQTALTNFQKRSRENSVYHGMEILLELRNPEYPKEPAYCPVVFLPHTADMRLEVLDLFAPIPFGRREKALYVELHRYIYDRLVRKDERRDLDLQTNTGVGSGTRYATTPAFSEVDRRAERAVTLSDEAIVALHQSQRYERVERWLENPHRAVTPGRLRDFVHFTALNEAQLTLLAKHSFIYTAAAGARLIDRGMSDEWNFYLLEGEVALVPAEGATLSVTGGSEKARAPIAFLKPRKYTVNALSKISFLWIHDAALRKLGVGGY